MRNKILGNRIKITENFYLDEFIHPDIYRKYGKNSIWFLDAKIVYICQQLRTDLNVPITINNWAVGGNFKYSGLRPLDAKIGAKRSQHKFGRAADPKGFGGMSIEEVFNYIMDNENKSRYMDLGLTTIENIKHTPTWLHLDTRLTNLEDILIVNP